MEEYLDSLERCLQHGFQKDICYEDFRNQIVRDKFNKDFDNLPPCLFQEDLNFNNGMFKNIPPSYFKIDRPEDLTKLEEKITRYEHYFLFTDEDYERLVKRGLVHKKFKIYFPSSFPPASQLTPEQIKNYIGLKLQSYSLLYNFAVSKRLDNYFSEILKPIYDDHKLLFNYYRQVHNDISLDTNIGFLHYLYLKCFPDRFSRHFNIHRKRESECYGGSCSHYTSTTLYLKKEHRKNALDQLQKFYDTPWPTAKELQKYSS